LHRAQRGKRIAHEGARPKEANMKALACTLGVILSIASPVAALDIRFDDVVSVGNPLVTSLETDGYRFTAAAFRTIDTPGGTLVSNGSPIYIAHEAGPGDGITLTRVDGGPFLLYEFEAAGLFTALGSGLANAEQVSLLGVRTGGALLSISYTLGSSLAGFAHFLVPASWHSLESVTFTGLLASGAPAALALDDIGVGEGPVPAVAEPSTILLLLTSAVGVGLMLLRHRGHPPVRGRRL
jgi:hypothetical protein